MTSPTAVAARAGDAASGLPVRGRLLCVALLGILQACAVRPMSDLGAGTPRQISASGRGVQLVAVVDDTRLKGRRSRLVDRITGRRDDADLLARPYGVAWDGDALLVTDPTLGRIARIDERSRATFSRPGLFESPIGIAVCGDDIVVTDSRRGDVILMNRDLEVVRILARELDRPTGVACVGSRPLVVETGRHRVLEFGPLDAEVATIRSAGMPIATWGGRGSKRGEFNFPTTVAGDPSGVWVGDTLNFRIQLLDLTERRVRREFGQLGDGAGEMPRIKGIAVDAGGRLWISDAFLDQVALYEPDGTYLGSVGARGQAPGQFQFPAGIAAHPDGRVAVVDSLNRRIQIFRVLGRDTGDVP